MIGGENTSGRLRRRCSSMVEHQLPKLNTRVRFPSSAPQILRSSEPFWGSRTSLVWVPNPVTGTRQVHNPLHSVISQCESNENGGARGPRLGILQFIDAVRLVVPRPESVSIARTVRRVLSTSKPMVAGTSVRLPSISDSSATTNKWVWKLSPLGLRTACQLNIAKTICRSAPIRRGPQLTHECRSSHNHNCERTQVRQKITFEKHQVRILPQYRTALTVSPNARHRSAH